MAQCEVCGNEYAMAFEVKTAGVTHTFDSFECAIHKLAPVCEHCGCKIVGHGIEAQNRFYCCAHCAHQKGATQIVDNASHAGLDQMRANAHKDVQRGRGSTMQASSQPISSEPTESWRGSGLAEDVDVPGRAIGDADEPDAREERSREAEERLGFKEPEPE